MDGTGRGVEQGIDGPVRQQHRAGLRCDARLAGQRRVGGRFHDLGARIRDQEDAIWLQEEVAFAARQVQRGELDAIGYEQANRRKVGVVHAGIHGEYQPLAASCQRRRQPVQAFVRAALFIVEKELQAFTGRIDRHHGKAGFCRARRCAGCQQAKHGKGDCDSEYAHQVNRGGSSAARLRSNCLASSYCG